MNRRSHRGQSQLKMTTRARPVTLKPLMQHLLQWGESSPAKHGGAYFSAVVWPKILAITEKAIEKPHALHNSLRIHLARTFGATGKEQPSPPLHPAAAARLLSCRALRWCSAVFVWLSSIGFPNFWQIIFLLNSIAIDCTWYFLQSFKFNTPLPLSF